MPRFRTRSRSGQKWLPVVWNRCCKSFNTYFAKQSILGSENTTIWNLELWGMIFVKDVQISLFTMPIFVIPITKENRPINFNFLYR